MLGQVKGRIKFLISRLAILLQVAMPIYGVIRILEILWPRLRNFKERIWSNWTYRTGYLLIKHGVVMNTAIVIINTVGAENIPELIAYVGILSSALAPFFRFLIQDISADDMPDKNKGWFARYGESYNRRLHGETVKELLEDKERKEENIIRQRRNETISEKKEALKELEQSYKEGLINYPSYTNSKAKIAEQLSEARNTPILSEDWIAREKAKADATAPYIKDTPEWRQARNEAERNFDEKKKKKN